MTVTETKTDDAILLAVDGNVDTNTANQLQTKILQAFQKSNNVVIDMAKCPYMSSAGLRALLFGHKTAQSKGGSMKLRSLTETVAKVINVTRFDKVLTIE